MRSRFLRSSSLLLLLLSGLPSTAAGAEHSARLPIELTPPPFPPVMLVRGRILESARCAAAAAAVAMVPRKNGG